MRHPASKRVDDLPPYLFSRLNQKKQALRSRGVDIIDLGIGDPDLPTPAFIKERLIQELEKPVNMRYSTFSGCPEFREAVASFYKNHFNVDLDPEKEVLTLIGSKEGIAHLIQAMVDPEDTVIVPDPGYPVYRMAAYLAGASVYDMALTEFNRFRPVFEDIPVDVLKQAKLAFLNYPGNPTGATVDLAFFEKAIAFFKSKGIWLAHDSAYNLVTFDDHQAPSILQAEGAKDVAVEFGSLSKAFNMTGWRIAYVVGNEKIIDLLKTVKSNLDSSQFLAIQKAAATALTSDLTPLKARNAIYEKRSDVMLEALSSIGIEAEKPGGSIFLWLKTPKGETSADFCESVMEKTGVILTPGTAFGRHGEGYFRLSLSVPDERLLEAADRIRSLVE
ncbi:LL-diaminopimelate aminotransferase [Camelliibacillus cellulosilyticus]|uniref:Aminotransferase n=1 Tax=Camelliibacillus cellulosilyticus TaxID=2174486 RepID=A0ABV9GHP3_9BACL